jgi:hypothetical protein
VATKIPENKNRLCIYRRIVVMLFGFIQSIVYVVVYQFEGSGGRPQGTPRGVFNVKMTYYRI